MTGGQGNSMLATIEDLNERSNLTDSEKWDSLMSYVKLNFGIDLDDIGP